MNNNLEGQSSGRPAHTFTTVPTKILGDLQYSFKDMFSELPYVNPDVISFQDERKATAFYEQVEKQRVLSPFIGRVTALMVVRYFPEDKEVKSFIMYAATEESSADELATASETITQQAFKAQQDAAQKNANSPTSYRFTAPN